MPQVRSFLPTNTWRCLSVCLPACLSFQLALLALDTSTEARVYILYVYKCTSEQMYNCSKQRVCAASLHCASSCFLGAHAKFYAHTTTLSGRISKEPKKKEGDKS